MSERNWAKLPKHIGQICTGCLVLGFLLTCAPRVKVRSENPSPSPDPALSPLTPTGLNQPVQGPPTSRSSEVRGVWMTNVDSSVLNSAAALEQGFDHVLKMGLNTVYPVVWNKGFTLYPSSVAERLVGFRVEPGARSNWDMLESAVEYGKKRSITVIPWFEYGLKVPRSSKLFREKPEWFTRNRTGTLTRTDGIEFGYLNPAHVEVRSFLRELMVDLVRRYDVAGVQIDDHFSIWKEFGYDDLMTQKFKAETGKNAPDNFEDKDWVQFRANQITSLVVELSQAVRAVRAGLVFSVSSNTHPWSLVEHLQDWPEWVRQGAVGEFVLQNYHVSYDRFEEDLGKPALLQAKKALPFVAIGILAGVSARRVAGTEVKRRIARARQAGFGTSLFFYESITNIIPDAESAQQRTEALEAGFR